MAESGEGTEAPAKTYRPKQPGVRGKQLPVISQPNHQPEDKTSCYVGKQGSERKINRVQGVNPTTQRVAGNTAEPAPQKYHN